MHKEQKNGLIQIIYYNSISGLSHTKRHFLQSALQFSTPVQCYNNDLIFFFTGKLASQLCTLKWSKNDKKK